MWRGLLSVVMFTMLNAGVAYAQETKEETFQSIAKGLQSVQQAISRGERANPSVGEKTVVPMAAPVFNKAQSDSSSGLMLLPNIQVEYQGSENGFAKVVPLTPGWSKGPIYLESKSLFSNASNAGSGAFDEGIKRVGGLAKQLENNPYVRVKGFSVSVALPPSINIEFEMK